MGIFIFSAYERICQIPLYTLIHQFQLIWILDGDLFSPQPCGKSAMPEIRMSFKDQGFETMIIFHRIRTLSTDSLLLTP